MGDKGFEKLELFFLHVNPKVVRTGCPCHPSNCQRGCSSAGSALNRSGFPSLYLMAGYSTIEISASVLSLCWGSHTGKFWTGLKSSWENKQKTFLFFKLDVIDWYKLEGMSGGLDKENMLDQVTQELVQWRFKYPTASLGPCSSVWPLSWWKFFPYS